MESFNISNETLINIIRKEKNIEKQLSPRLNKYIPVTPTIKQKVFLIHTGKDVFFGGSAGPGKSVGLLMAALQYADMPGYNAIILRNTFSNLVKPEGLISRSMEWLNNTDAEWRESKKRWEFPSGATLSFGYLDGPRDHFNYQGAAFQFVGIDEIVQIRENQALYLFSRLRRLKGVNIPIRFRATSNPPAREQIEIGAWVKKRYIDPETRGNRIFIPAKMEDNKHLDIEEYRSTFAESGIDPITRRQLEEGDWNIQAKGKMLQRHWFEIVDRSKVPIEVLRKIRYWDMASTEVDLEQDANKGPAYTAGVLMTKSKDGIYYILSIIRGRWAPLDSQRTIRQTADVDGLGVHIYMEQEPGSSGVTTIDNYRRNVLAGFVFYGDPAIKKKETRWGPFASQAEAGNIKLVNGYWNEDFLNEAELVPSGPYKDQVDAASGAFLKLAGVGASIEPKIISVEEGPVSDYGVLKKRWI
jgi:predicted phage terminase large subunit-like protein